MGETLEITRDRIVTVTNHCICMYCDECEMGFWYDDETGYTCPECGHESEHDLDCMGCWGLMTSDLEGLLEAYEQMHSDDAKGRDLLVVGAGMAWRRLSGYRVLSTDATGEDLARAVGVNTDWTQQWRLTTDGKLTCSQSHHDAMGEAYEVLPLTLENILEHDVLSVDDMQAERAFDILTGASAVVSTRPWPLDEEALETRTRRGITALQGMAERIAAAEWEDEGLRGVAYDEIIENATYDI